MKDTVRGLVVGPAWVPCQAALWSACPAAGCHFLSNCLTPARCACAAGQLRDVAVALGLKVSGMKCPPLQRGDTSACRRGLRASLPRSVAGAGQAGKQPSAGAGGQVASIIRLSVMSSGEHSSVAMPFRAVLPPGLLHQQDLCP